MRAREFSFGTNLYLSGPELSSDRCLGHQLFFYLIASPHHYCYPGIYLDCFKKTGVFCIFCLLSRRNPQSPLRGDTPAPWPP
jgi:hypothetical protein